MGHNVIPSGAVGEVKPYGFYRFHGGFYNGSTGLGGLKGKKQSDCKKMPTGDTMN
jgi:hypothetical protein